MRIKCSLSIPIAALIIVVLMVVFGIISGNAVGAVESDVQSSTYQVHSEATVISRYEATEAAHTPVHGCTVEDCTETYLGEQAPHSISNYINSENGTHTATCSICGYIVTETHTNGTNANCSKCNYVVISSVNNGNITANLGNSSGTNGNVNTEDINLGNNAETSNNANTGNINITNNNESSNVNSSNSSVADKTQADGTMPQTGVNSIVLISSIVGFMILATMAGIQINRYRDI